MKHRKKESAVGLWGDPIETLTLYNTMGLFAAVGFSTFNMMRFLVLGFFSVVDRIAWIASYALAWLIVAIVSGIALLLRLMFLTISRTLFLICIQIPFFMVRSLVRTFRWVVRTIGSCAEGVTQYTTSLPERAYEILKNARTSIAPSRTWGPQLLMFMGLLLLFTLPFPAIRSYQFLADVRAETESVGYKAMDVLQNAQAALKEGDTARALSLFQETETIFSEAHARIEDVPSSLRSLAIALPILGKKISSGQHLVSIGSNAARIGVMVSRLLLTFSDTGEQTDYFPKLVAALNALDTLAPLVQDTATRMAAVDTSIIPLPFRDQFSMMRNQFQSLSKLSASYAQTRQLLLSSLGGEQKRRYLLLFQNNTELRPTGGFLGSYALIDVYKGKLTNVEIPGGGTYDLQGQLSERVRAPQPLHLVNARWELQDANWFPDFPTSAKKILWFYEKAGGPTVDGVIAINAAFFEDLLSVIGTISLEDYSKELTHENFITETQKAVELEYDHKENKPKQFIADLFQKTTEKLGSFPDRTDEIALLIINALTHRDIQVFLKNSSEQELLSPFGVSGVVRDVPGDYQMIISANVGGGKSDAVVHDEVTRETIVRDDGTLEGRITLIRKHEGVAGTPFTGITNSSYLRFYLPRNTQLLSASGFRIPNLARFEPATSDLQEDELLHMIEGTPSIDPQTGMIVTHEFGKSVFANWLVLEPGQEATVTIHFLLPFTVGDLVRTQHGRLYSLLLQKQSGTPISSFRVMTDGHEQFFSPFESDQQISEVLK